MNQVLPTSDPKVRIHKIIVQLIGIGAILWGSYNLFHFSEQHSIPSDPTGFLSFMDDHLLPIMADPILIISGYGLLRFRNWARNYFFLGSLLYLLRITTFCFLFYGSIVGITYYASVLFTAFILLGYLSIKSVRDLFPYKHRVSHLVILFLIINFGFLLVHYHIFNKYDFRDYIFEEKAKLEIPASAPSTSHWTRLQLPFEFSIAIPQNSVVSHAWDISNTEQTSLQNSSHSWPLGGLQMEWTLITQDRKICRCHFQNWSIADQYAELLGPRIGLDDKREVAHLIYRDKYGVLPWFAKNLFTKLQSTAHYKLNDLDVYHSKSRSRYSHQDIINIYKNSKFIGEIQLSCKYDFLTEAILSTLQYHSSPQLTVGDYIQDGNEFMRLRQHEKATFSFGSAIYLDINNADYYLKLAEAQVHTEPFWYADLSLKKALELQPDIKGVKRVQAILNRKTEEHNKTVAENKSKTQESK